MTLKEVEVELRSRCEHYLTGKAVPFTFPKQASDIAFFVDTPEGRRFWFLITESAIPAGTTVRLSQMDEEAWKAQALKHFSKRTRMPKVAGVRNTASVRNTGRESID